MLRIIVPRKNAFGQACVLELALDGWRRGRSGVVTGAKDNDIVLGGDFFHDGGSCECVVDLGSGSRRRGNRRGIIGDETERTVLRWSF